MTCHCGRVGLYRVGTQAYCAAHHAQANLDATRTAVEYDRTVGHRIEERQADAVRQERARRAGKYGPKVRRTV